MGAALSCSSLLDVLEEHLLSVLTRRQALKLGATCKALQARVAPALKRGRYRARLLVVCSGANTLQEYNLATGALIRRQALTKPPQRASRIEILRMPRQRNQKSWPTCIAISPYDGNIYVCQYKVAGVLVLDGETLRTLRVMAIDNIETPEGIAFSHGCTYIASAEDNTIYRHAARSPTDPAPHDEGRYVTTRFPKRGRHRPRSKSDVAADHEAAGALTPLWLTLDGPGLVPWGMVAGPDRSLYVAVDTSYEAPTYIQMPSPPDTGQVLRIALRHDGTFEEPAIKDFCYGRSLRRPSGLCFDTDGNLLVTCGNDEVVRFEGPGSAHPGRFISVLTKTAPHPFDVVHHRSEVIVATHTGTQGQAVGNAPCLTVYNAGTGAAVRRIGEGHFAYSFEPNMMAVE